MQSKSCYIIIKDDEDRDLLETTLRETDLGYEVIAAHSMERVKERLDKSPDFLPTYIFIDWDIELLKHIKSIGRLTKTKVIVYATNMNSDEFEQARQLGAENCILKATNDTGLKPLLMPLLEGRATSFVLVYPGQEDEEVITNAF